MRSIELSETHLAFIELDKQKDEVKKFYEQYKEVTEKLVAENGVGHYFQDADGTVYKTVVPEGKFVQFEKFSVNRTRRGDERAGSLSLKEAKENGFEIAEK